MTNLYKLIVLTFITFIVAGCLETIGISTEPPEEDWFGRDIETSATITEIDQVSKLKSDQAKYNGFKAIAGRDPLPLIAQVHLVRPVITTLYSLEDKEDILLTLIGNPSFTHAAKKEILERLNDLGSEESKMKIIKAINERNNLKQ